MSLAIVTNVVSLSLSLSSSFPLNADYVATLTSQLGAVGKEVDFGQKCDSLKMINGDVELATKGLIKQLLEDIDPSTRVILINAIYFKGLWDVPFNKSQTEEKVDFHTSSGKVVKTAMMFRTAKLPFYQDEATGIRAVQLDYQSGNMAMVFILPKQGVSLEHCLQTQLTCTLFANLLDHLKPDLEVKLRLPRFKLASTHQLVPVLTQLGVRDIFKPDMANLNRMTQSNCSQLFVSDVIQKTMIEVNEEGTEAAAANAIKMQKKRPKIEEFNCNRPFLFALVTKDAAKQVFFIGTVEDPTLN